MADSQADGDVPNAPYDPNDTVNSSVLSEDVVLPDGEVVSPQAR